MPENASPVSRRINPWTVWMLVIIIALGVVVGANVVKQSMQNADPTQGRPRLLGRIEVTPERIERSGRKVTLAELAGSTYIASYVYTSCPKQCMGVLAELRAIGEELGNPEKLKFVAFSLEPETDRPERLKGWAELHGVDLPSWWFLTTDKPDEMTALMTGKKSQFKLMEVTKYDPVTQADIIAAEGPYAHDSRVVLVDGTGHIRGYYNLLDLDASRAKMTRDTLLRDVKSVLAEQAPEGRSLWWMVALVVVVVIFLALTGGRKPEQPAAPQP
jgi:cytochrome oxidase Cu insertion factor (SCO1/SenC/PrrC family)